MDDVFVAGWIACFNCMEKRASQEKNEKVAAFWRAKIEQCKACKKELFSNLDYHLKIDALVRWARTTRRCALCMLDDIQRFAEDGDQESAEALKNIVGECTQCMFDSFNKIDERRARQAELEMHIH
ncbi:MAG: hypothetical protein HXS46_00840 [Theionarchaea archaeon]|nr:hypothetical protein [Theionarchaea archaeon]